MGKTLLYLLIFAFCVVKSQDKVYFLNGTSKECQVLEIAPEQVIVKTEGETETFIRDQILLIKFKNGSTEIINTPTATIVYNPARKKTISESNNEKLHKPVYLSVNTLALCNADVSAFYEYVPASRKIGIGLMGAYNFNLNATAQNLFIAILPNAKKNYDLGLTLNLYPGRFEKRTTLYIGTMFKYTSFSFNKETSGANSTLVTISAAQGSQLATLFTAGSHTSFGDRFFIRTICGIGAFKLKGDYKEQYNREINKNTNRKPENFSYLPKIYLGLNAGFNF